MTRWFVYLNTTGDLYAGQPTTGFASIGSAFDYMERKSMLPPERYSIGAQAV